MDESDRGVGGRPTWTSVPSIHMASSMNPQAIEKQSDSQMWHFKKGPRLCWSKKKHSACTHTHRQDREVGDREINWKALGKWPFESQEYANSTIR